MILAILKHVSTPGTFSPNLVAIGGYLAIMAIFALEVLSANEIPFHVLYIFPLTAVAIHCGKKSQVIGAVILSIVLQVVALLSHESVSLSSKLIITIIILASNAMFASVAHYAREHYLEAERLSTIDWLTGLPNRRSVELITDKEIARHKRYGGVFSFAIVDLDDFKELNDSRGHAVGDEALKIVAEVLRKQTRESDMVARLGGDEFGILMPNTQAADSASLCQQLSVKVARRMADVAFPITASIGCTTFEQTPESTSDVFMKADKAMYSAKAKGKGCVVSL